LAARVQGPKGRSAVEAGRARVHAEAIKISEDKAKRDFSLRKTDRSAKSALRSK